MVGLVQNIFGGDEIDNKRTDKKSAVAYSIAYVIVESGEKVEITQNEKCRGILYS